MRRLDWTDALTTIGAIALVLGLWQMAPAWAMVLIGFIAVVGGLLLGANLSSRR